MLLAVLFTHFSLLLCFLYYFLILVLCAFLFFLTALFHNAHSSHILQASRDGWWCGRYATNRAAEYATSPSSSTPFLRSLWDSQMMVVFKEQLAEDVSRPDLPLAAVLPFLVHMYVCSVSLYLDRITSTPLSSEIVCNHTCVLS